MNASDFLNSFYGLWFQHLPEQVICGAIDEVQNKGIKTRCPKLYDEYIKLQTVMFLLAYTNVGNIEIKIDGESVSLKSLSDSGAKAYVKKDAIDSSLSREYHKPVIPEGMEASDFPYGRIKSRIDEIEKTCNSVFVRSTGYTSNNKICGSRNGKIKDC